MRLETGWIEKPFWGTKEENYFPNWQWQCRPQKRPKRTCFKATWSENECPLETTKRIDPSGDGYKMIDSQTLFRNKKKIL